MNKTLIVAKQSKYEYEREKFGLSHEQLVAKYSKEHANLEGILESHEVQIKNRQRIISLFNNADLILMCDLKDKISGFNKIFGYDLIISFGGDNSFTYTTHFAGDIPIMGINSDPKRSVGALCKWSADNLEQISEKIGRNEYKINNWTRLEAEVDGKKIAPATSEYFFGEKNAKDMSRHVLIYRGKEFEQKCSGILLATGAGSTGWYESASQYYWHEGRRFAKTDKKAAFIIREPYKYKPKEGDVLAGDLFEGEELVIHSLNDGQGFATSDCWEEFDFSRGKKAIIRISDKALKVLEPQ